MRCFPRAASRGLLLFLGVFIVFSLVLVQGGLAQVYGPKLLIQEQSACDYWPNGTEKSGLSRTGQVFVAVPNNDDVLQYINVTLLTLTATNIRSDAPRHAYQDVLVSNPNDDEYEYIWVNTTNSYSDTSYTITDALPTINLSLEFKNVNGGIDLYDDLNIDQNWNDYYLNVTMTNPSSTALNNVNVSIWFDRDMFNTEEVHIYQVPTATGGTPGRADADSDGYYDVATWEGNIGATSFQNLSIRLNITENTHFSGDSINLDANGEGTDFDADEGGHANYANEGPIFSGITVDDKFTRGPIRQGVDLAFDGNYWLVRGLIRNMGDADSGQNLTYNMTGWAVHEVDAGTGDPYTTANQSGSFGADPQMEPGDGRIYTNDPVRSSNTTLYNTSSSTKPYIAMYFNWEVLWNSSNSENNLTYINTTMDLPTLYLVDLVLIESITGTVNPEVGGENITISENITNVGADESDPLFVQILSFVPNNTTLGEFKHEGGQSYSWLIHDDVEIWLNGSDQVENDSSNCVVTITSTSESAEGLVNLSIYDLASCTLTAGGTVGHILDEDQEIRLVYRAESNNQMTTGDIYNFGSIGQLNSSSDTKDQEYNTGNQTVPITGRRVTGYKDLIAYTPSIPTLINASINISIADTVGSGIAGIKFMDFVPYGSITYADYVGNFSNGDWVVIRNGTVLTYGTGYDITDNGTATLPDGLIVQQFEFVNATGNSTWNLTDGEYIEVSYQINYTTPGVYVLPVMIAAYDPDTGISLATTFYGLIKVVIPEPNVPLSIDEGGLKQSTTVLVGKPAVWIKEFDVFNPNPRTVSARFESVVFEDATDGYVTYYDAGGRRVEEAIGLARNSEGQKVIYWDSSIGPFETRNYEVNILTPPVLEIDRDVEVLEQLPEKKVRLKMDVYLKSFAQENYENVILNLPIGYEKIEEVRDGFGNRLPFTGGKDTTSITVNNVAAGELKTISVIYKESYPTIIITPDRDRYNLNSPVSLEILVINGGEKIDYPYLEIEIYTPGMDVIYTNIEKLEDMEPLEKTELYEKFVIPAAAPSGMYIASARFREDFAVLASATGNFYVLGVSGGTPEALEILMIILVSVILVYFSFRRLREVRTSRRQAYGGI